MLMLTAAKLVVMGGCLIGVKVLTTNKDKQQIRKNKAIVKKKINYFIAEKKIYSKEEYKPYLESIDFYNWGIRITLDISMICGIEDIEKHNDYLKQLFRAESIEITNKRGRAILEIFNRGIEDLKYEFINLSPYELLLGYDRKGNSIIANMGVSPNLAIQGLPNSGKSKCIEIALKNLKDKADIILLNAFDNDFKSCEITRRIKDRDDIIGFLSGLLENKVFHEKPLYIVIDEINLLSKDKEFNLLIGSLLKIARHLNIVIIVISQSMLKEVCPYKQLFNSRLTFKMIDKSTIGAFLGCNIEDTELRQREFILYSEGLTRGRTYTL